MCACLPHINAVAVSTSQSAQSQSTLLGAWIAFAAAMAGLVWGVVQFLLSRTQARSIAAKQAESSERIAGRTQFQVRLEYALELLKSRIPNDRFIGALSLKNLTADPLATPEDRAYALRIAEGLDELAANK